MQIKHSLEEASEPITSPIEFEPELSPLFNSRQFKMELKHETLPWDPVIDSWTFERDWSSVESELVTLLGASTTLWGLAKDGKRCSQA